MCRGSPGSPSPLGHPWPLGQSTSRRPLCAIGSRLALRPPRADLGLSMRLRATRSLPSMLLDGVFELSEQLLRRVLARDWSNRCRLFLHVVFRRSGGYVRVIVAHALKDLPPRQHRQTNWPRWVNAYPHF